MLGVQKLKERGECQFKCPGTQSLGDGMYRELDTGITQPPNPVTQLNDYTITRFII